jgi:hypothetical protein
MSGESVGAFCQFHPDVVQCPEWLASSKEALAIDARGRVDAWLQGTEGLNQYGDEEGRMYLGGNPLFNEMTGEMYDLYQYVAMQHSDAPWMTSVDEHGVVSDAAGDDDAPVFPVSLICVRVSLSSLFLSFSPSLSLSRASFFPLLFLSLPPGVCSIGEPYARRT